MQKFVALYDLPPGSADFERAYVETHLPLISKVPGLERTEVSRVIRVVRGDPGFSLMAEMYFPDQDVLRSALSSQEWAAAGQNLDQIGGLGFARMFIAETAAD